MGWTAARLMKNSKARSKPVVISFKLIRELSCCIPLCWQTFKAEVGKIKQYIIYSEAPVMIKSFFQAIEALFRAVMYLLILLMGLSIAGLGAYIISFF